MGRLDGKRVLVAGGAGFIGSHLVDWLLTLPQTRVTVYDNLSSGTHSRLSQHLTDPRMSLVEADLQDLDALVAAMRGQEWVFHFASNPDIAKAMVDPSIDFWQGTYLTQNLLEAMRAAGVRHLVYASGSGVYGDVGTLAVHEDFGPMLPISTYGASKLAGEALICAYCHLFDLQAYAYRFANVVGLRQTHGVAYDFIRKLQGDPTRLEILGDGTQSKSYIHVSDIVQAIGHTIETASDRFNTFNVATEDYLDVRTIARMVCEEMGLHGVRNVFTGGSRGWKGDVPVVRFDLTKIHSLEWRASMTSAAAMQRSIAEMLSELEDVS
jgi:UDP-glucose 4-epimerase